MLRIVKKVDEILKSLHGVDLVDEILKSLHGVDPTKEKAALLRLKSRKINTPPIGL
jgi:hypothetical protein